MRFKFLIIFFLLISGTALAAKPSVTTAVPVVDLIAQALLEKTPVQVIYLPPKRLPINRIPAWLNSVGSNELAVTDAVLTVESVSRGLAVFSLLRQKNIRLVAIDLAQEITPKGAGITQRQGISEPDYFWLDTNNLLLMVNIAARDLARLWPEYAKQINHNRGEVLRQIQQLALQVDELLLLANVNSLALSDEKLMPLAQVTILPLVEADVADLVLSTRVEAGKKTWVIDPLLRPSAKTLEAWLESVVVSLQQALIEP